MAGRLLPGVTRAARIVGAVSLTILSAPLILFGVTILLDLALGASFRRCITRCDFWTVIALYSLLIPTPLILAQRIAKWKELGVILSVLFYLGFSVLFVSHLFDAMTRGQLRRTIADLGSIARAVESYTIDHEALPVANDIHQLADLLEPRYLGTLPRVDDWGTPLRYLREGNDYWLISYGACGRPEVDDPIRYKSGQRPDYSCDIVYANGELFAWPDPCPCGLSPFQSAFSYLDFRR